MRESNNPVARQKGLVVQEMEDEILVYDMTANKGHCLNKTAAFVWKFCDGNNSVDDIVRQFESTGGGRVTEDFVWVAIDQLNENGLLEQSVATRFQPHSRRHVLKAIGLASMVALPIVASLVTPPNALSAANCSCVTSDDCRRMPGCPSITNCNPTGICAP